jgi:alpha-1,6-mannosyltransferase
VELARYYRAADLFVHPGTQETFGLVALESQACGTPVVGIRGSRLDGIILHDQQGWAETDSPAALAEAIEQFSRRDLRALGATAVKGVAEYSWPHVFERLFCIYREVCANYSLARP